MRKLTKRLIFTFCCGLLCLVTSNLWPAVAQSPVENLQKQQEQINQERKNLVREQQRLTEVEKGAQRYLQGLQQNLRAAEQTTQDLVKQISAANQTLQTLEAQLAKAQQVYDQKRQATVARLRLLQRSTWPSRGLDILLASRNFQEFFAQQARLEQIYQADQRRLYQLRTQRESIQRQKQAAEMQKNQISLLQQQLWSQRAQFSEQMAAQRQLIDRLNKDRVALEAADAQLKKDSEQISSLIQRRMRELSSRQRLGTGRFGLPSKGELSSNFGWRVHPIFGYERFHAGVDFAEDYGSPITAADGGVVILADWYGGYGYTVVIDHGAGISTLYAHASQIKVSDGQTVKKGETIALVGSTGLSTGPHLHFEVRENGSPVDPIKYLQ